MFAFGKSIDQRYGPHVIVLQSDLDALADAALALRNELAHPTAKTVSDFLVYWNRLFDVGYGFYDGYIETGRDWSYADRLDLDATLLENLMISSNAHGAGGRGTPLEERYRAFDTFYCHRAVGLGAEAHGIVAPYVHVGWWRAGVTDVKKAVAALRANGLECARDDESIRRVFDQLTTLRFLAEGLTIDSIVSKELLDWLPRSMESGG